MLEPICLSQEKELRGTIVTHVVSSNSNANLVSIQYIDTVQCIQVG